MAKEFIIEKNGIPIYEQLYRYIKGCIEDGTYKIGSVIPSESEMQKQFGISRITVRRAISDLEHDGYVRKRRGAGTVVEPRKIERDLSVFNSFGGSAKVRGDRPGSIILQFRRVDASTKVAEKLGLQGVLHLSTHSMRKTFGYNGFRANGSEFVTDALGHYNEKNTLTYLGIDAEYLREGYEGLCMSNLWKCGDK